MNDMTLPRFLQRLLQAVLPWDRLDDVLGDVEETHRRRCRRLGPLPAAAVSLVVTLGIVVAFGLMRFRDRDLGLPSRLDWLLALRLLRRQPVLTAAAVTSLAAGIGVAAVAFTMADAAMNAHLDVPAGQRYVIVDARDGEARRIGLDTRHVAALRAAGPGGLETFDWIGGIDVRRVGGRFEDGTVQTLEVASISPDLLDRLPAAPLAGRQLEPADAAPGAPAVVVVSEELWRRVHAGDPSALGSVVQIGGVDHEIVGVAPRAFRFPHGGDAWTALRSTGSEPARLGVLGILSPTATRAAAAAEVTSLLRGVEAEPAQAGEAEGLKVTLRGFTEPPQGAGILGSAGVAVTLLVLTVIAANVAQLLQARTASRARELGLRTVLGAPRSRILAQLSVEAGVMAFLAALVGLAGAVRALEWIDRAVDEAPFWLDLTAKPRTAVFACLVALLVTVVAGLLPALRATRRTPLAGLAAGASDLEISRRAGVVMVAQMALSIALLSGAMVLARGLWAGDDLGLRLPGGRVLTAQLVVPEGGDAGAAAREAGQKLRALPGVIAAGASDHLPRYDAPAVRVEFEGRPGSSTVVTRSLVGEGFLESLDVQPLRGRLFRSADFAMEGQAAEQDDEHAGAEGRVAVVNEPFVERFLGGGAAIGERFRALSDGGQRPGPWLEIVGVVPDLGLGGGVAEYAAGYHRPGHTPRRYVYLSLLSRGEPRALEGVVREALLDANPTWTLERVQLLEEVNAEERAFQAGFGATLSALGLLALLLSLLGIYAMISFTISRRTREIGVRVALGAGRSDVLRSVLGRAGLHLGLGAGIGAGLGLATVRLQDRLLAARLPVTEPWILPSVLALFAVAGVVACVVPSRRALRIEPAEALRTD